MSLKYFLCDVVMYLVITSDGFEVPETFLEIPNLVAIDLPVVLSVWIRMLIFFESLDSNRSDRMNKRSDTPSPIPYRSASQLESVTVACVLLSEVIRMPRKDKTIPEVLLLEVAQPAQSEST